MDPLFNNQQPPAHLAEIILSDEFVTKTAEGVAALALVSNGGKQPSPDHFWAEAL